jgi:predicted phosphodiesterase
VIEGHPRVFNALKTFLEKNGAQIIILPGNHDIDLHWPDVFDNLRKAVDGAQSPQLAFVKNGVIEEQRVYIEHGNQHSFDNWFEFWETPFLKDSWNRYRIERPWGTYFMDMVYNDLENLYPFVNKVYPHSRLATIAVRSLASLRNLTNKEERVSLTALARLVAFLVTDGKFFMLGRLLGKEQDAPTELISDGTTPKALPGTTEIEDLLTLIGLTPQVEGYDDLVAKSLELISDADASGIEDTAVSNQEVVEEHVANYGAHHPGEGLLGRTDARGMMKRQNELWVSGKTDLIVFGHTHAFVDGNHNPPYGLKSARRSFNTGSWMPIIPIGEFEDPSWSQLGSLPKIHDVRYLVLGLTDPPRARLESL